MLVCAPLGACVSECCRLVIPSTQCHKSVHNVHQPYSPMFCWRDGNIMMSLHCRQQSLVLNCQSGCRRTVGRSSVAGTAGIICAKQNNAAVVMLSRRSLMLFERLLLFRAKVDWLRDNQRLVKRTRLAAALPPKSAERRCNDSRRNKPVPLHGVCRQPTVVKCPGSAVACADKAEPLIPPDPPTVPLSGPQSLCRLLWV